MDNMFDKEYVLKLTDKEFLKTIYHRTAMKQNEDIIKMYNLHVPRINLRPEENPTLLDNTYDVFEVLTFIYSLKEVFATIDWNNKDAISQQLAFHELLLRLGGIRYVNHLFYLVQNEIV